MFNLKKKIVEESIYVKFDEGNFSKDSVNPSESILDELISFPSLESHDSEDLVACIPFVSLNPD